MADSSISARQIEIATELLNRAKAKESLYEFVRQAWHLVEGKRPFTDGWHIKAVCDHVQAVITGDIRNLLINQPPRTCKSNVISVMLVPWVWIRWPEKKFLYASYAYNLAERDSIKARHIIKSDWYQRRWGDSFKILSDQDKISKFTNDKAGVRQISSPSGATTGEGGDVLICHPYNTIISTNKGQLPIGEIVDKKLDVKILSYNHEKEITEYKSIEEYEKNLGQQLIEIDLGDRVLECTENHPIFVVGKGYIPASSVIPGDKVVVLNDK